MKQNHLQSLEEAGTRHTLTHRLTDSLALCLSISFTDLIHLWGGAPHTAMSANKETAVCRVSGDRAQTQPAAAWTSTRPGRARGPEAPGHPAQSWPSLAGRGAVETSVPWSQCAQGRAAGIWWRTVLWAEETLPTRACEPPPPPECLGCTTPPPVKALPGNTSAPRREMPDTAITCRGQGQAGSRHCPATFLQHASPAASLPTAAPACLSPNCSKSSESRAMPTSLSMSPAPPLTHSRHPQTPYQVPDGLLPETHGPGGRGHSTYNSAQSMARTPARSMKSKKRVYPKSLAKGNIQFITELKLQHFGHMMQRADSLEKTLMLGKTEGRRRRGRQRTRWMDGITDPMDMSLSKLRSW